MSDSKAKTGLRAVAMAPLVLAVAVQGLLAPTTALAKDATTKDPHAGHIVQSAPGKGYTRSEMRHELPEVTLVDSNGARVPLRKAIGVGAPVMVNFIFTSCTAVCPTMSAIFAETQRLLEAERLPVRMVSISIDPEYDTPARLREYAARLGAGPEWRLYTGSRKATLDAARAFDAWRGDKMNHTASTYLYDGMGKTWVRLDGFATPADLVREYRALLETCAPTARS